MTKFNIVVTTVTIPQVHYGAILTVFFWRPKFQFPPRDFGTLAQVRWPTLLPQPSDCTAPGIHQTRSISYVGGCPIRRWIKYSPSPFILAGNVGVVSGIFFPQTTDTPTCHRTCRCVGADMSATSSLVGSSDAVSMLCRHDDYPTCLHMPAKKLLIVLQYYATIK